MQLRLLLIATVVLGVGTTGVTQFIVRPHIKGLVSAREQNLQRYQHEQRVHRDTTSALNDAQAKLEETERNLFTTRDQLLAANTKAVEREQLANRLESELNKAKQELAAAKADLAAWAALGIPVNHVEAVIAEVKKLRATNEAMQEELRLLASLISQPKPPIDGDPVLPTGLKGQVLVVDPKYDFVVLDIGTDQGVQSHGKLLVAREGQLVAKVSVSTVQPNRCIANVIPGWKLHEVKEGDHVLH
jgi:hypothetical protein